MILCEDTRVTLKLLNHIEAEHKPLLVSYHEHNEEKRIAEVLELLSQGKDIALVSDAGTPLVSDPGAVIVRAIHDYNSEQDDDAKHVIIPLPGPCAVTTALSASGLDGSFAFEGFLPHSGQHRRRVLKKLIDEARTMVFYESPHRITKTLADMQTIFGEREVFLARELTKKFEEFYRGSFEEVLAKLKSQFKSEIKGEFVLICQGKTFGDSSSDVS